MTKFERLIIAVLLSLLWLVGETMFIVIDLLFSIQSGDEGLPSGGRLHVISKQVQKDWLENIKNFGKTIL